MKPKIYLEPRDSFDEAIVADEHPSSIVYNYHKLLEVLVRDFISSPIENEEELFEIADEYFWFNIERLKDYYAIGFDYEYPND